LPSNHSTSFQHLVGRRFAMRPCRSYLCQVAQRSPCL
jgi:hypothetical protein